MIGLAIGCVIFGMGSIIVATVHVGAYAIAFWRLFVAWIIFFVLMKYSHQALPKVAKARNFALISGMLLAFDLAFWHESIYAVGPGISTLLNSLQIFFLALMGYLWFGERLSKLQLLNLVLAVIGVAMIASPELNHNTQATWGFVMGVASGVMLAGSMVFIRKTHQAETVITGQEVGIFPLMFLLSVGGLLALLVPMLIFNMHTLFPTTASEVGLILIYGAVMQCFAWGLIAYSIPKLSLSMTGLLLLTEPIAALIIDYFYLHKAIVILQWLGVAITLLAIYLGSIKPTKPLFPST